MKEMICSIEKINPSAVIQTRLAESMGLNQYRYLEEAVNRVDVSTDPEFHRIFDRYYMVRRNAEWRACYYQLFEEIKKSGTAGFNTILDELFRQTGNVEASFASKMLATLQPDKPIWDKYVVQNLRLKLPSQNDPDRIQKTKSVYDGIVKWYEQYLTTENAKECIAKFDETLPDYAWLSDTKKIDFYLWSIR